MPTSLRGVVVATSLAVFFQGGVTSEADAAVMCRRKSGAVFIRDATCKRKETSVDVATLGLIGPPGPNTSDANTLYVGSDQDGNDGGSTLAFGTDDTPRVTILENGNVGIGTANPATPLAIAGTCSQGLTDDGLVKGWARINADGTIASCYNCNTDTNETRKIATGQYEIDFSPLGSDVTGRPRLAAMDVVGTPAVLGFAGSADRTGDPSSVFVLTGDTAGTLADRSFVLLVY